MEPALNDWIRRFTSPLELFSALPQLYANLQSQHVRGTVEDGAIITGPVHIGEGAVVQGQAIIKGPVIVGTGTVVNGHVEIQGGSFIGSNCVIGHACSIVQSMLMNNTNVGPSSFVRNCVVGFGSVIGPGAVLGAENMRSIVGSPMSGSDAVILGDYSAVGPNCTVALGTIVKAHTVVS